MIILFQNLALGKDYFVHPTKGNDTYSGDSKNRAFKTLKHVSKIKLLPGDRLLLASGETYDTGLEIKNTFGTEDHPILITSVIWDVNTKLIPAIIDFKGEANGILIEDSCYIKISNINVKANGYYTLSKQTSKMRCGILITSNKSQRMNNITLSEVSVFDVFYENSGFARGKEEVETANGTQKYGWGVRIINNNPNTLIDSITIENSSIKNVSHTGIKLTGNNKNIRNVIIKGNTVEGTGGPGIQMSGVKDVHVINNHVTHSGSSDDTRKWGRGSGLWTWGSSNVLIEKNKFLYSDGPGDSAGAHIDYNCDNIVLQYNISAYNAGGFCEILGNNYNCSYRYNISINDGHRVKGVNGAFQEGKILWLSGYQGQEKKRKGPVNSYFYNNTIYSDSTIVSKIAIDNTSSGILIVNNIFYLEGISKAVLGDQYKPDLKTGDMTKHIYFKNNLFLNRDSWPENVGISDSFPVFGNPKFAFAGGIEAIDYVPSNLALIRNKGLIIDLLPNDKTGLLQSLNLKEDILGNPIKGVPSIGAIEPKQ